MDAWLEGIRSGCEVAHDLSKCERRVNNGDKCGWMVAEIMPGWDDYRTGLGRQELRYVFFVSKETDISRSGGVERVYA